jgi:uncharacterized protein YkwD
MLTRHPLFRLFLAFVATATVLVIAVALPDPAHSAQAAVPRAHAARACSGANRLPAASNLSRIRRTTLCLLNRQRARHHLPRLRSNRRLQTAARAHSADMVRRDYFEHTTPNGVDFASRILREGYVSQGQTWSLGENIAFGTGRDSTPRFIVNAWMHSPGHRANILRRGFRDIGIGIVMGVPGGLQGASSGATYTTDFGGKH